MAEDPLAALLASAQVSDEDRRRARSMALLATGLGLLGAPRGQELQSFGRAGLLGIQNYNEELQQLRRDKLANIAAQNAGMEFLAKQQAWKDDQEARGVQVPPIGAVPPPTGLGMTNLAPTPANAAEVRQRQGQFAGAGTGDLFERYMAQADALDQANKTRNPRLTAQAEKLREQALKFRNENLGLETVMGPDGNPVLVQRTKYGAPTPVAGYAPKPDYKEVNLENKKLFYDPLTNKTGASFDVGVSPSTVYSGNVTMRGQNLADARAREQLAQGAWTPDLERGILVNRQTGESKPITAGGAAIGPKDIEQKVNQARDRLEMANRVIGMIDSVAPDVGMTTAGIGGAAMASIPGTAAYDVKATAESIKANLSFDQLTALRAASPTGGALGQVSDMENRLLQASVANLDMSQSPGQVAENLKKVREHLSRVRDLIAQGQRLPGAAPGATGGWSGRQLSP